MVLSLRRLFEVYYFNRVDKGHKAVLNISDKQMFAMFKEPKDKKWEIKFKKYDDEYKIVMTKDNFDKTSNVTQPVWIDMYMSISKGKYRKIRTDHSFIRATMYFLMKKKNWLEIFKEMKSENLFSVEEQNGN